MIILDIVNNIDDVNIGDNLTIIFQSNHEMNTNNDNN